MLDKKFLFLILGSQLQGAGTTLQKLDPNTTGLDDLGGTICKEGGLVLEALGLNQLHTARDAVQLLHDATGQWLDDNPDPQPPLPGAKTKAT